MGCTHSKVDDLPAVALCRQRCGFLDEAIHHRYALADSHLAYLLSLKSLGPSLHRFFDQDLDSDEPPVHLNLPPHPSSASPKKPTPPSALPHHHSHSHSGSHLHFHSDEDSDSDEDDSDGEESLHHHHHLHHLPETHSPLHYYADSNSGMMHMNFMRKYPTPSVSYQHRPVPPEMSHHMGEAASSSSYYPLPPYANYQNPSFYPPPGPPYFNYPNFGAGPPRMMQPNSYGGPSSSAASTSKEPPPPPSPPRSTAWDFLNPFDGFDKYYPTYPSSRNSREVREEEGIPDLEEEEEYQQHEVVKEIHGNHKFVVDGRGSGAGGGKAFSAEDEKEEDDDSEEEEVVYRGRPSADADMESSNPVEYDVHVVDKKVVGHEDRPPGVGGKSRGPFKGDFDILRELQLQFDRASDCGNELSNILEVGKHPYNRKHAAYQVSSKMMLGISPRVALSSNSSASKHADLENNNPSLLDVEGELALRSTSLSSTLHKLYLWEKKLYEEVKVEEKMRVLHERKCSKLSRLDQKGAEAHKVDATRAVVRSLSTKIRIAIQVVDKISVKINTLRDEELWPQLNEFIQGLTGMWKTMLECHHIQSQAIAEAKRLDAIASRKRFSEAHVDAISQLGHELVNWTLRFSCWITAQKGYVKALNNWLMKCLLYVPEETPDGIAPFSPGRIGAPPIFIICNQWSQALEMVSEKEVVDAMRDFARSVLHLWEQDKLEIRQRSTANKEMEKKVRNFEKEDQKMQKEIQALDKRMLLASGDDNATAVSGQVVYQSDTSRSSSLQMRLHRIFDAMERFMSSLLKVYEDMVQRIKEDNLAPSSEK